MKELTLNKSTTMRCGLRYSGDNGFEEAHGSNKYTVLLDYKR